MQGSADDRDMEFEEYVPRGLSRLRAGWRPGQRRNVRPSIISLRRNSMIVIEKLNSEFGEIKILKYRAEELFLYMQEGYFQSEADRNGISLAPYVHAIYGLLAQVNARDILLIGCGGGSLGTMLGKTASRITIVDKNAESFRIARKYFGLPRTIECHVADGREFLLSSGHRYDAIILDAYDGDCIPEHMFTVDFFRLVRSHLDRTRGCLLANVHAWHDLDRAPDQYAAVASCAWNDVRLLDIRGVVGRNALVLAGNVRALRKPALLVPPLSHSEEITSELNRMAFRPWHFCRGSYAAL
jgi:spermidine synthase